MNPRKSFKISEELRNKIIAAAYGDAGFFDKRLVKKLSRTYPEVKALYDEFHQTAEAARSIKIEECPENVLQKVNEAVGNNNDEKKTFFYDLYTALFSRPMVSAAAFSVIIILVVASVIFNKNEYKYNYSQEEIALADKQVKESLLLVGRIFNKAQTDLTGNILSDKVAKPISQSLNIVNDLFNEGDKNENSN